MDIFATICYLTLLCLTGCAVFDAPVPYRDRDAVTIRFSVQDSGVPDGALAVAYPGEPCTVIVRPSVYPACVTHEVAHCLGWRHDNDKYNSMYCKD